MSHSADHLEESCILGWSTNRSLLLCCPICDSQLKLWKVLHLLRFVLFDRPDNSHRSSRIEIDAASFSQQLLSVRSLILSSAILMAGWAVEQYKLGSNMDSNQSTLWTLSLANQVDCLAEPVKFSSSSWWVTGHNIGFWLLVCSVSALVIYLPAAVVTLQSKWTATVSHCFNYRQDAKVHLRMQLIKSSCCHENGRVDRQVNYVVAGRSRAEFWVCT